MRLLLLSLLLVGETSAFVSPARPSSSSSTTELELFRRLFRRNKNKKEAPVVAEPIEETIKYTKAEDIAIESREQAGARSKSTKGAEEASICIIGGGVAGLTAGITAGKKAKKGEKIVLLEASETVGGRVQSDVTEDGFILDRGFAVFIKEYPTAQSVLDYDALKLGEFRPGALVKIKGRNRLAKVADPLRQPEDLISSIYEPVGSIFDKLALLPLIYYAKTQTVEELFEEREFDTETALVARWNLGEQILDRFFRPFLEGIYLAPLEEQSSRMFSFVFKMFTDGLASLPAGGMGAVSKQLLEKATKAGVDVRTSTPVVAVSQVDDKFLIETLDKGTKILADSVVVATDATIAQRIIAQIEGFESLETLVEQPQRKVGCLYYSFKGEAPVEEPVLILNGIGAERGTPAYPVNNACFPSQVCSSYAPSGYGLCSATILKDAVEYYEDREADLDKAVRAQLATWFPDHRTAILNDWELKAIYDIENAQPGQLLGPAPANVFGGRRTNFFRGKELPKGMFVCGDHVATATLNGALESGVNAGQDAIKAAVAAAK